MMRWLWLWLALASPPARGADLPVVELPVADGSRGRTPFVVFFSGDGGWAEFDAEVSRRLQAAGWPVVGLNSLKYFWTRRSPEEAAQALARLIDDYGTKWQRERVVLVGFSQGADVLAFAANRLPPELRARIALIVLLGPAERATFEVKVGGWFGVQPGSGNPPVVPEVLQLTPRVLVVTGAQDQDAVQHWPGKDNLRHWQHPGDHHLGRDYDGLTRVILEHGNDATAGRSGTTSGAGP